jgi:hypothetical protein
MAKGQFLSGHQQGIVNRYYSNLDTISLQKLGELVSDIAVCTEAKKLGDLWQRVHKALQKTPADPLKASRIVAERNTEALAKLVGELSTMKPTGAVPAPARPPAGMRTPLVPEKPAAAVEPPTESKPVEAVAKAAPAGTFTPELLAKAMAAFKKRLKMNQLDHDSKLGRSPLSSGKARVTAITPPREYPRAVWDELFAQGKIRPVGGGMFELVWTPEGKK